MGERVKALVKGSVKPAFAEERKKGAFEPRDFTAPAKEAAMPASDQGQGRADLLDAYLQRKSRLEAARGGGAGGESVLQSRWVGSGAPRQLQSKKDASENRTGMPDRLKEGLEQASGMDLSGVRVHYNSAKPAQLNALAYTQGRDIHVGPSQERNLPHEGWHAVQQMQGRVRPTVQAGDVAINDDEGLEREADVLGTRALQTRRPDPTATAAGARAEPRVRRKAKTTATVVLRHEVRRRPTGPAPNANSIDSRPPTARGWPPAHTPLNEPPPLAHGAEVVQLLGKTGHIVIGAAIGTILPILGNIIGGYIGYRIWKSKQSKTNRSATVENQELGRLEPKNEDRIPELDKRSLSDLKELQKKLPSSGKRTRRVEEEGEPQVTDKPKELLEWIEKIANMIKSSKFEEAYAELFNKKIAEEFGVTLRPQFGFGQNVDAVKLAEDNMSYAKERRIKLCAPMNGDWLKNDKIATKVLPMHLEEYMHQYQAMSGSFLSSRTSAFKMSGSVSDIADTRSGRDADFDEIDVMAMLSEWGFDVEEIDYVKRYKERGEYWKWWKSQSEN